MIFSCFEAAVKNSALLLTIAFLFSQISELSGEPSVQSADKSRQERQKSEHLRRNAAKNRYKIWSKIELCSVYGHRAGESPHLFDLRQAQAKLRG